MFKTLDTKKWLFGKDPDAGKDWRQVEKGTTEDEMVGWYHQLKGHEFEQAPGIGDGQWSLACCSPLGHKGPDMTKWRKWTELNCASKGPPSGRPHQEEWDGICVTAGYAAQCSYTIAHASFPHSEITQIFHFKDLSKSSGLNPESSPSDAIPVFPTCAPSPKLYENPLPLGRSKDSKVKKI